ncbi:hypothetical protein YTPLAS72_01240 [Nitrospira sp.]|nr:hypothetical protein YTPLAS72_01240 [Nitrospira sp.]
MLEAGIKYLVLSAAPSVFVQFGLALLYFSRGVLTFAAMQPSLTVARRTVFLAIIGLGVYPIPFIDVIEQAAAALPIGTD